MVYTPKCEGHFFKIIEDNTGKYLHNFGVRKNFFKGTQKALTIKKV